MSFQSLLLRRLSTAGTSLSAALFLMFAAVIAGAGVAGATESDVAIEPTTWFDEMTEYYEQNPELKTQSGSGYKPFMRYKHFYEHRLNADGSAPAPRARLRAWERKKEIEATLPPARASWFALGPNNFGGRMLAVDFDPNDPSIVYAGAASGGVWKSTDSGSSWVPLTDEMPVLAVGGLAVSKTDSNIIVIGTGEGITGNAVGGIGIWRSTDAGATWGPTSMVVPGSGGYSIPGSHGFHVVECGPNGTFLAGATDGLYRSSDDGATWTAVKTGPEWYDVKWDPEDPNRVYTVRGDAPSSSVKHSTDDGVTWTFTGVGQPGGFMGKSKLAVSGSTVYCLIAATSGGGIWDLIRSTDDGANWTSQGVPSTLSSEQQAWYNLVCVADPNPINADFILCGGQQLGQSGDGGVSFINVTSGIHVDQHDVQYEPGSNSIVWMANDGGMYRSLSDGFLGTWTSKNNGLATYQFYDICVNNGPTSYYILGGTQDNGTDKWSGTTTWANGLGGDGMVCNIAPNGTTVYAETQNGGHYRSLNSGGSFAFIGGSITGNAQWVTPTAVSWFNSNHVLTESSAGIWRSTNGTFFSNVASHRAEWIDYSQVNGNYAWTASAASAIYWTSNGTSWTIANAIPFTVGAGKISKILAHPTDLNTAFVTFSGYNTNAHIAMTTDLGVTWVDVTGDFAAQAQPVNAIAVDPTLPNEWFIGTDVGVWRSGNGGVNWTPWETGFPNAVVLDLEIADGARKLVAGTHGRGAWEINLPSTGTDAAISVPASLNLMLDPPSPNPARGRTLLRYAAKSTGTVSLKVFDVQGRLVSDLEDFSAGDGVIRTTPWFTDDVPAGVYFAVLQTGAERMTQKITVIK